MPVVSSAYNIGVSSLGCVIKMLLYRRGRRPPKNTKYNIFDRSRQQQKRHTEKSVVAFFLLCAGTRSFCEAKPQGNPKGERSVPLWHTLCRKQSIVCYACPPTRRVGIPRPRYPRDHVDHLDTLDYVGDDLYSAPIMTNSLDRRIIYDILFLQVAYLFHALDSLFVGIMEI